MGKNFLVVSAPGTVYTGKIESLHIEKDTVHQAKPGQQVGLKISDFKRGKVGDLVECFERVRPKGGLRWNFRGGVLFL